MKGIQDDLQSAVAAGSAERCVCDFMRQMKKPDPKARLLAIDCRDALRSPPRLALIRNSRLRCRKAGDRDAIGGAGDVVHADAETEID